MASVETVARPYAKAAFEFADEKGLLAEWNDKLALASLIAQHQEVGPLLTSPTATAEDQAAFFADVGGAQFDDHFKALLLMLAENGRLGVLPEIQILYEQARAEAERRLTVTVRAATRLDEDQKEKLAAALSRRLDRNIELECVIDSSVIGGAVIEAGDYVIDGSLRRRLMRMGESLQE